MSGRTGWLAVVLAACGAPASVPTGTAVVSPQVKHEWRQVLPTLLRAGTDMSSLADSAIIPQYVASLAFVDATMVWQCSANVCSAWPLPRRDQIATASFVREHPARTLALPCNEPRRSVASRHGVFIAVRCESTVHVIDVASGAQRSIDLSAESGVDYDNVAIALDDAGTATLAIGNDRIVRDAGGKRRVFPLLVPADSLHPTEKSELVPANEPWLAVSHGAFSHEVAWRATDPPTEIPLGGGAIFNGPQMWVSRMENFYVRMDEATPFDARRIPMQARTKGAFFGALADGGGVLWDVVGWEDSGLAVSYENAVLLVDRELDKVDRVDLPGGLGSRNRALLSSADGTVLALSVEDGRMFVLAR